MDGPVGVALQRDVADEGETEPVVGDCAQRGDGETQQLEKKGCQEGIYKAAALAGCTQRFEVCRDTSEPHANTDSLIIQKSSTCSPKCT